MSHFFSTSTLSAACTSSREHCLCRGSHHWRMPSAVSIASECATRYASMLRMSRSRSASGEMFFKKASIPKRLRRKLMKHFACQRETTECRDEKGKVRRDLKSPVRHIHRRGAAWRAITKKLLPQGAQRTQRNSGDSVLKII